MRYPKTLLAILTITLLLPGCNDEPAPPVKIPPQASSPQHNVATTGPEATQQALTEKGTDDDVAEAKSGGDVIVNSATVNTETDNAASTPSERTPPTPPVLEDFQGQPKLSLFPRVGDFQPPPDGERHPYWRTFIDHLVKVTGVAENQEDGSRGWVFRSVNSIDSLGYFAPLQVEPNKTYKVSFKISAILPEGASAGVGVLEFDKFLWIGEQYTEKTFKEHYRGVHEGKRVSGEVHGKQETFTFTTGPDTHMIHLVLFREGPHDRNGVMFDDIEIK